ncbi:hypothetical protein WKW80_32495 [Variovorax humicola]|uniref:Uncharacterized protein n=1 Tax=Variovorax humicola TaxID=1769758 RepID=A0ABU8W9G8_9BURK
MGVQLGNGVHRALWRRARARLHESGCQTLYGRSSVDEVGGSFGKSNAGRPGVTLGVENFNHGPASGPAAKMMAAEALVHIDRANRDEYYEHNITSQLMRVCKSVGG